MRSDNLLFSIIVPVYNVEAYLPKCVDSILNQTYKNFELILVDDGSPDNSGKMCDEYAKKDSRVKVVHKENGGLSSARNAGIDCTNGEFLLFVDSDDFIENNTLEILYKKIIETDCDIVCFNIYEYRNERIAGFVDNGVLNRLEAERKHIMTNPSSCRRIYRTELFTKNDIRFKEGIIYEDLALIPALSNFTSKISFVDDKLYYYVLRENSIMRTDKFKENRDDKFKALESLENIFIKNSNYDKYKEELEYVYIKHLLIVYTTEIVRYGKEIYKPRIERALEVINNKFPNWFKNKYLKLEPIQTRVYLTILKWKVYLLIVLINKVFDYIKKK